MISRIGIRGLGPHEHVEFDLDARGVNVIRGPSEAGKSSLLLALSFCLWGEDLAGGSFPVEAIRDDADRVDVQLTLGSGTQFTRSMTRSRTTKRHKGDQNVSTEKEWRSTLGPLGKDVELLRLIMVPFAWQKPLAGAGNGRPLRDLLTRILPTQVDLRSVVAELMTEAGAELRQADPVDEPTAVERRKESNRSLLTTTGRLDRSRELLTVAQAERISCPTDDQIATARALQAAAVAWKEYRAAEARFDEAVERNGRAAENLAAWRARRDALGKRPAGDDTPVVQARAAKATAQKQVDDATAALRKAQSTLATVEQQLVATWNRADTRLVDAQQRLGAAQTALETAQHALAAAPTDDTCPTCHRDGWAEAAASRARLQVAVEEAGRKVDAADADAQREQGFAEKRKAELIATDEAAVAAARERVERAQADVDAAKGRLAEADGQLEQALALGSDATKWDAAARALGPEPRVPDDPERPTAPASEEPTAEQVAAAAKLIAEAARAKGEIERRAKDIERGTRAVAETEKLHTELAAEAERLDKLVDAVRKAPSIVAERNLAALGDLGPVEILLEGGGVEIRFDGRPWWLASRGRQIVCDLWLRAALRRAVRLLWLPLIVDSAQDWSGEWPAIPGAIWFLRTEPCDGLEVLTGAEATGVALRGAA